MATPVKLPWFNNTFEPATGTEGDVDPLPVFIHEQGHISAWKLTDAEIKEVVATGIILVHNQSPRPAPILISTPGESIEIDPNN